MATGHYDFIIVGGGSAGSALANRLTADGSNRVLVLEAGRPDYRFDVFIHMPAALTFPIGSRFYDWKYESEPEPHMNSRRIYHARGKVLGGSSSINGMIFQRGNPLDYERWAADPGMEAWDYAHCLPYFKRMETCLAGADEFRGDSGPLVLERGPATNPLFSAFFEAVQQAGYPLTSDVNGYRQEGFAAFDRNINRGRRLSAARAYLHPVMRRPNLDVETRAFVTRILFEGARAVGVEYRQGRGPLTQVRAGEVIVCGGAINSPQLLQLSGVGAAAELQALGIDVVADVPAVGENLQDHLEVYIQYACKQPVSMAPAVKLRNRPWIGLNWLLFRKGPGATNHFEGGGFVRSNEDVKYPNLMFHFLPIAIRYDGSAPAAGHGYQVHIGPMYSDSRGSVKIRSTDPTVHPALRFNYISTDQDRREWVEAIRIARDILNQPAMDDFNAGELSPGSRVSTDAEILEWVARDGETALHPSCTCRLGTDETSVVDPSSMQVHGLSGLRVVDASVMRYVTNGNIYAPVMMIAEKSADLILGNTPLAPEHVEFYRHGANGQQGAPAGPTQTRRKRATRAARQAGGEAGGDGRATRAGGEASGEGRATRAGGEASGEASGEGRAARAARQAGGEGRATRAGGEAGGEGRATRAGRRATGEASGEGRAARAGGEASGEASGEEPATRAGGEAGGEEPATRAGGEAGGEGAAGEEPATRAGGEGAGDEEAGGDA